MTAYLITVFDNETHLLVDTMVFFPGEKLKSILMKIFLCGIS